MSRTWKIIWGIVILLVALLVAGIAVLKSTDFNQYRGLIEKEVKAATGRDLSIAGNLDLALSLSPAVVVEGVTFANAGWGSRPEMVRLKRLEAEVELLPLISGDVRVNRLVLVGLDVLAETNAQGKGNWEMAAAAPAEPAEAAKPGEAARLPVVHEVRLKDVTLTYRDGRTQETMVVGIKRLDAGAEGLDSPLRLDIEGAYNGAEFQVAGQLGSINRLITGNGKFPIDLKAKALGAALVVTGDIARPREAKGLNLSVSATGDDLAATVAGVQGQVPALKDVVVPAVGPYSVGARITGDPAKLSVSDIKVSVGRTEQVRLDVAGAVSDPLNAKGLNLAVTVEGKDVQAFSALAGAPLPKVPPFRIAAKVADTANGYTVDDLQAKIGKSDLAGRAAIALTPAPLSVQARLTSTLLDLGEILPEDEAAAGKPAKSSKAGTAAGDKRVFPDDPLPLEGLRAAAADIGIKVGRLVLPNGLGLEDTDMKVTLKAGHLKVQPLAARVASGRIDGSVDLDGSGNVAVVKAKIVGKDVDLGALLKAMKIDESTKGGKTDMDISLAGRGRSVRQLMASLDGHLQVSVGAAKIKNSAVDWAGGDIFSQLYDKLNPLAKKEEYTDLKCAVGRFLVKDGMAEADKGIAVETSKMTVVGSGALNLKTEALDFGIRPQAREGMGVNLTGSVAGMVRVRGTLAEPAIGLDALGAAKTATKVGTALATGGLSLLAEGLIDRTTADPAPCLTALGKAPKGQPAAASAPGAPATPAKEKGIVGSVTQGVGGAVKGVTEGVGGAVKGVTEGVGGALKGLFGGQK